MHSLHFSRTQGAEVRATERIGEVGLREFTKEGTSEGDIKGQRAGWAHKAGRNQRYHMTSERARDLEKKERMCL